MNIDMKIITIAGQLLGLVALIPLVVVLTLWIDARGDDGPSVVFRGGMLQVESYIGC